MSEEKQRMTTMWQNIVKVWAAESAEKMNDITYVNGIIPKGNTAKMTSAEGYFWSNVWKSVIVVAIVM